VTVQESAADRRNATSQFVLLMPDDAQHRRTRRYHRRLRQTGPRHGHRGGADVMPGAALQSYDQVVATAECRCLDAVVIGSLHDLFKIVL
jgi:hypothetical protein